MLWIILGHYESSMRGVVTKSSTNYKAGSSIIIILKISLTSSDTCQTLCPATDINFGSERHTASR